MQYKITGNILVPAGSLMLALILGACGSGGGGNDGNTTSSSNSVSSASDANASSVSSTSSDANTSSVSSVSSVPSAMHVTVSDAYVLEANVTIGGSPADIWLEDGAYEWSEIHTGVLRTLGGANDLADPKQIATEADPNALALQAPVGYHHINPFTTMLVMGGYDLNATYPAAAAVEGEDGLAFNYDVVKAGDVAAGGSLSVAKDVAKAALTLAAIDPISSSSESSSSVASSASVSSSSSAVSSLPGGGGGVFPAAARASDDLFAEIDACQDNACIDAILLREMIRLRGAYAPPCEPLPGEETCSDSSASSISSLSSSSETSSAGTSSQTSVSSSGAANSSSGSVFP